MIIGVQAFMELWQNERLLDMMEQIVGRDVACHPVWNLRVKMPHNPFTDIPWHQGLVFSHLRTFTHRHTPV